MKQPPPQDVRAFAALAVAKVLAGRSLPEALAPYRLTDRRDQALMQLLAYGVMRLLPRLAWIADQLLQRPFKAKDQDVYALLLCGIYQHMYTRIPPHAATAATVNGARVLGKPWAVGLVNGVLRNFQRRRETLLAAADAVPQCRWAHPEWLLAALQQAWPAEWQAIAEANNTQPPMGLRVNQRKSDRDRYLAKLAAAGITAAPMRHAPQGIVLATPCDVSALPGFAEGEVSVQDEAAQLAAGILDVASGMRVLDACAAPGGKTAHILETCPEAEVTALDASDTRLQQLHATLARLDLSCQVHCADGADLVTWWDGQPFQRILLDAPCSAGGVIRRHPDIKALRRPEDPVALAARQAALLAALWQTLAPQGFLVYVTCSVWPEENHRQVTAFLQQHPDAVEMPLTTAWGRAMPAGRQILPGEENMDGFYYACLCKKSE